MRVLVVIGTRPEGIKLAPLVTELQARDGIEALVCLTAQHREMLDQVVSFFDLPVDFDLDVMQPDQHSNTLSSRLITGLDDVLTSSKPDFVVTQGDTTSTFAGTWSAFHRQIPVGHVEAGLRSHDLYSPWPEEANRRLTSVLATQHYAPTRRARENLISENVPAARIFETGNTVVDALHQGLSILEKRQTEKEHLLSSLPSLDSARRMILVTSHRRESFGPGLRNICTAIESLSRRDDVELVFPVHPNPNVRNPVEDALGRIENVHLMDPVDYPSMILLLQKSHIVLTDSGGIQEEAPSLGKPVLVMRDTTERLEGVEAGTARLVGTDTQTIIDAAEFLLDDEIEFRTMSRAINPYGDGQASSRIADAIEVLK